MASKKFIKMDVNMFKDSKFKLIKACDRWYIVAVVWMNLLLEAGRVNDKGLIYLSNNKSFSIEMLSKIFDLSVEDIKYSLEIMQEYDMININDNGVIQIMNWCAYQEPKPKTKQTDVETEENVGMKEELISNEEEANVDKNGIKDIEVNGAEVSKQDSTVNNNLTTNLVEMDEKKTIVTKEPINFNSRRNGVRTLKKKQSTEEDMNCLSCDDDDDDIDPNAGFDFKPMPGDIKIASFDFTKPPNQK